MKKFIVKMGILYECCLSFFLRSLLISEERWIGAARPVYSSGNTAGSNKIVMNPDKKSAPVISTRF
jgi:hypothetical protein